MRVTPTAVAGVLVVEPAVFDDSRGFFMETWHAARYRAAGIDAEFVQENQSQSCRGTLRGLHYQVDRPQGKLVRAVAGEVFDVAVDLRRSSPTFGRWHGAILSADNKRQLWIPPGCAHGFAVTSDHADLLYLCTEHYAPELERTIAWDDATLNIAWPVVDAAPLLSTKDASGIAFVDAPLFA